MSIFKLPDLGEGLQEAEIVEWHVAVGDDVSVDQPLVSVETDKAIVEIPAPHSGKILKLFGAPGDIVHLNEPVAEIEGEAAGDAGGSVVGEVRVGTQVVEEAPVQAGRGAPAVKVTPAVRALAHRLEVDLTIVMPSGPDGLITAADVRRAADELADLEPAESLRGVRRAMAQNMMRAGSEVVPATVIDDADIHAWRQGSDPTVRLVRAIAAGCRAEPSLNAWYEAKSMSRRVLKKIDVGIAVDTADGLFVPVLRNVGNRDAADLRKGLDRMRADVKARTIPPDELRGYTIMLTNFGTIAGTYTAAVLLPPAVAILGAGRICERVVAVDGKPVVHRMLPLSLTFDHRAVTGGEAGRFLAAAMRDLALPT